MAVVLPMLDISRSRGFARVNLLGGELSSRSPRQFSRSANTTRAARITDCNWGGLSRRGGGLGGEGEGACLGRLFIRAAKNPRVNVRLGAIESGAAAAATTGDIPLGVSKTQMRGCAEGGGGPSAPFDGGARPRRGGGDARARTTRRIFFFHLSLSRGSPARSGFPRFRLGGNSLLSFSNDSGLFV